MPGIDLAALLRRRLALSEQVAATKFRTGQPVEDPVREQRELARVRVLAAGIGLDPDRAADFLAEQITASKQVQHRLFARWTDHPDELPTAGPDLSVLRAELDALTSALLERLALRQRPVPEVSGDGPAG
ncbi:gamma subclass chorismate mutase AroQ [Amycolatopsis benzoatilytica]|uniref:gamma subclass chorismate mutase AroQ n=1 Tax=Amycolatopsis benzoatilytica TaxID=346045 RepID=UPI00036265F5|nr:gamma subclass chorismate mutase AroQ [Amycolatopsis benzoatilytica]